MASTVRSKMSVFIPVVIGISLGAALAAVGLFVRSGLTPAQFGFARCSGKYLAAALIVGAPFALGVAALTRFFPHKPPFDAGSLAPWQIGLYFVVAAPIQEEVIFRGLVQSYLQGRWSGVGRHFMFGGSAPVAFTSALFGIIHLDGGAAVAVGALVLALLAGELRRRSGSLLPAIVVHLLFNLASMLAPP